MHTHGKQDNEGVISQEKEKMPFIGWATLPPSVNPRDGDGERRERERTKTTVKAFHHKQQQLWEI